MQIWQQNYDPLNNIWLSSLIALLPVLFFFFALIRLKMKGYQAATLTVVLALAEPLGASIAAGRAVAVSDAATAGAGVSSLRFYVRPVAHRLDHRGGGFCL